MHHQNSYSQKKNVKKDALFLHFSSVNSYFGGASFTAYAAANNFQDTFCQYVRTRAVSDAVDVPVIASGGVGTLDHLADGVQQGGADAVLAASIFHYGEFTVAQAKARMAERGIPVRI